MTKKILLIILILLIIGVAAFLILSSTPREEGEQGFGFSIRDYIPFGRSDDTGTVPITDESEDSYALPDETEDVSDEPVPRLRKLSSEPAAGASIFNTGTTSIVRFVEKGTGNVYEADSETAAVRRLTNTTIPKILRAFWLPDGSGFLAQTLTADTEIIETSFVKLNKNAATTSEEALTPFYTSVSKLPTGIKEVAVKPDSSKIFYYTESGANSSWHTSNPDGTKSSLVYSHPLTEWIPNWISGNIVMMQTKGSGGISGYVYSFDVSSKVLKKIGFGVSGISSKPSSSETAMLISSGGLSPKLYYFTSKNMSSLDTGSKTIAEKCVWTKEKNPSVYCATPDYLPKGKYPDDWYKGTISTGDFIEKIDLASNLSSIVADLSSISGEKIDVVDVNISPDNTHLIFRNKIDGFLWMLRVGE